MTAVLLPPRIDDESSPAKVDRFQIPALDGLRAVSILIVFVAHLGLDHIVPGGFGVTVFFGISGYLITTLLRREYDRHGVISLKSFYIRRVLRIIPSFYIVVVGASLLAAVGILAGRPSIVATLWQLGHLTNYRLIIAGGRGMPNGSAVFWSLAVEEHFYLIFPLIYIVTRRRGWDGRRQAAAFAVACLTILAWRCFLVYGFHVSMFRTYRATDTRIDSILFGCILAVWRNPVMDSTSRETRRTDISAAFLGIVALLATFALRGDWFRETFRYTIQGLALMPIISAAIKYHDRGVFRILSTRPMVRVGIWSYTIYLTHLIVIVNVRRRLHTGLPATAAIALLITAGLSWAMFRYIERPLGTVRKRFST